LQRKKEWGWLEGRSFPSVRGRAERRKRAKKRGWEVGRRGRKRRGRGGRKRWS
jgi:hypothetical protein